MATVHLLRPAQPDVTDVSDGDLAIGARSGQNWAREQLFRRHSGIVYGLAVRLAGPRDAKDITQDVFVQAFQSLANLQDPGALRSWLCGITVRLVRRRLRRLKLFDTLFHRDNSGIDDAISAFASPDVAVDLRRIYEHVERLPERQRVAFLLRRVEGMKMEETAEAMGASLASVKRWVAAAEERIQKLTTAKHREAQ